MKRILQDLGLMGIQKLAKGLLDKLNEVISPYFDVVAIIIITLKLNYGFNNNSKKITTKVL
jgi:hypothetical protein